MKDRIDPFTGRASRAAILSEAPAGSLFSPEAHAKADGPASSKDAAKSVSSRAAAQCEDILAIFRISPQWTSQGLRRQCMERGILNLTARISDLRNQGHRIEVENHTYRLLP